MKKVSAANQQERHPLFDASGKIATGGTAQLVLGASMARSHLILGNNSQDPLWFEFDGPRATATITNGAVSAITVTNAGFNFTKPPVVRFFGGGLPPGNTSYLGLGQPNAPSPSHFATAHAVLTAGAVSSIVVDDPGAGYVTAPYVFIFNSDLDPNGCAVPSQGGGILLPSGAPPLVWNGTVCPTGAIAVWGNTTNDAFTCKWMD